MKFLAALFTSLALLLSPALAQMPGMNSIAAISSFTPPTCISGGNDSFTKVLLHMDGANGGNSFPDNNAGGVSGRSWSATTATTTTSSFKFGTASFLGAPGYISTSQVSDLQFGNGNFTVEFWANTNSGSTPFEMGMQGNTTNSQAWTCSGTPGNLTCSVILIPFQSLVAQSVDLPNDNNWHAIAFERSGQTFMVFVDGIPGGFPHTSTGSVQSISFPLLLGGIQTTSGINKAISPIDEVRISVGIARYSLSGYKPNSLPWCN